jgi:hypothetical protein
MAAEWGFTSIAHEGQQSHANLARVVDCPDLADVDGVKSAPMKRRDRAPREPLIEQ